ncbi:MAG TPA: hypothetical protein VIB11_04680, partial [Pedococcus sp.]|uniref:hypothetical protein n=1 Tax=Pedococcus sp. TaxID=2860345 RepID=UPI002F92FC6D
EQPPAPLEPFVANPQTSVYEQYGYAGLTWHTYDLGCGGGLRDTDATLDTTVGNAFLAGAVWTTSAANGLHNKVSRPAQYMAPLDDVVATVTQRLHDSIWSPWGGAALLGVAALLLFYSTSGRLSAVTSAAAWAVLVLAVVAGIGQYPTRVASFFDDSVTSTIAAVNASSAGLSSLPETADPARAQGALLVDRIAYDAWVRGEFGSGDSAAAREWAPALFKASAFTWAEAEQAQRDPEAGKRIAERKAESWKSTTAEIQEQDPVAYAYVQGKGGGRAGTGLMAFLGALFTGLFRLVADLFVFAGLVMLRLLVMFFPAAAVIGVMAPMSGIVRQIANMAGASVVNVVAFSVGSTIHTTVISAILSRATDTGMGFLALVLCVVVTLAAFVLLLPLLSFTQILGQSSHGQRLLKRSGKRLVDYVVVRKGSGDGTKDAQQHQQPASEPEEPAERDWTPRQVRRVNLPSEAFGRPSPVFTAIPEQERVLAGTVAARAELEPARHPSPTTTARPTTPATSPGGDSRPDPALDLAGATSTDRAAYPVTTPSQPVPVIEGVVVDSAPTSVRRLENLAPVHDSHHEVRPDGVGPRIYDPETKQTVLSVQRAAEEDGRR